MKATLFLIILCFLAYGVVIFSAWFGFSPDFILESFGFSGKNILAKPWIVITSIFLHKDIGHLLSNMFVLLFFGTSVENELGRSKMLLIFFLGAVAGDLLSLLFYSPEVISIGASAGVFALIGAGMLVKPLDMSFYPFIIPLPLGLLGILYAIYNALGFIAGAGNVSYIAHFGGLFIGLLFGFRHEGLWHGIKIILIMLLILILIPLVIGFLI